jgi:hypothetical protein
MIETIYCQCLSRPDCQDWVDRLQERDPELEPKVSQVFLRISKGPLNGVKMAKNGFALTQSHNMELFLTGFFTKSGVALRFQIQDMKWLTRKHFRR